MFSLWFHVYVDAQGCSYRSYLLHKSVYILKPTQKTSISALGQWSIISCKSTIFQFQTEAVLRLSLSRQKKEFNQGSKESHSFMKVVRKRPHFVVEPFQFDLSNLLACSWFWLGGYWSRKRVEWKEVWVGRRAIYRSIKSVPPPFQTRMTRSNQKYRVKNILIFKIFI